MLDRQDVIELVEALAAALDDSGVPVTIQIVGGAGIAWLHFPQRRGTVDIDALFSPREQVLRVASEIAALHGLPDEWLNDAVLRTGAIPFARDIDWITVVERGDVTVHVADARALLAMKLRAARPGRDTDDIVHLMSREDIRSIDEAEAVFEEFYPGEAVSERGMRILERIFTVDLVDEHTHHEKGGNA
ncbi:nucleotidyl transferase [Microbacterium sp. No. 7]|uniref:nucleotidyl transferase n=1 Tax=Microbacterium sp. No. 7 TaxID=1714373 RepID=UPI0006ED25A1|nr:nucleotidyl transferase [Microbacterium sp. No. 7]ALJ19063.1 hypothetical protein AOA12_03735 [Microbacterium sp. No. 7]